MDALVYGDWYEITLAQSYMDTTAMNYVLKCLANTTSVSADGYKSISFNNWANLDAELDSDILQSLVDVSPNAATYSLYGITDLSSDV